MNIKQKIAYLGTSSGLYVMEWSNSRWYLVQKGLQGTHITALTQKDGILFAGSKTGIQVSLDLGCSWKESNRGLLHPHVRVLKADNQNKIYAGTEPAAIFSSDNLGESWKHHSEVAFMRDEFKWSLPYSSKAGCIRDFSSNEHHCYAASEQGGVLYLDNRDTIWTLVPGSSGKEEIRADGVHADVHSLYTPMAEPDWIYACTGGGLYRSMNRGGKWQQLYSCYCRAAWIDPADPVHVIFGPADGVEINGRIEESRDLQSWKTIGISTATPWPNAMVEKFITDNPLLMLLSDGRVYQASSNGQWNSIFKGISSINDIILV